MGSSTARDREPTSLPYRPTIPSIALRTSWGKRTTTLWWLQNMWRLELVCKNVHLFYFQPSSGRRVFFCIDSIIHSQTFQDLRQSSRGRKVGNGKPYFCPLSDPLSRRKGSEEGDDSLAKYTPDIQLNCVTKANISLKRIEITTELLTRPAPSVRSSNPEAGRSVRRDDVLPLQLSQLWGKCSFYKM
ncbi:hypothetical protein CEXT_258081 [Caerostris extrusa]|uniref:Uncharacterized protein n=1 Tax=Caerostris extrusa TaxID=172846 RepID=A0AAV4P1B9_CAEEX|nr:hypothetical protein CEXT_258081 [Caerostris extrusa]